MPVVDLRSDTITQPTSKMRTAMANAELGDDVFGEDPTVARLETLAAYTMGKEAALFVSSGTMGNLVSQLAHCGRGDEIILGDQSHVFYYEQGGSAAVGGLHARTLPNRADGTIDPADILAAIRPEDIHFPRSRLLILENTHNRCNGYPLEKSYIDEVAETARSAGMKLHIDGARIFNAAEATGTSPAELSAAADSITFCLSKGLCAPVGSVLCGSSDFVARARRARKLLGGGMRQAGVLAAAGIVAIEEMTARLAQDHANAARLASGLAGIEGISLDPSQVRTNIVFFHLNENGPDAATFRQALAERGVRVLALGPRSLRAVTHHPITENEIRVAISEIGACVQELHR